MCLISIIIPTYNRAHLIIETIESILDQTYTNWECIIVDDGSTDNTFNLLSGYIEKDSRIQLHKRPKELVKGANSCRNLGFNYSKGSLIQWFDSDDLMSNDFLQVKKDLFQKKDDFVIALGAIQTEEDLRINTIVEDYKIDNLFKAYLLSSIQVFTPSIIFKKEFLMGKQLFNTKILRGQETEFFSRLFFKNDSTYKAVKAPLFYYRQHEESKSNKAKSYNSEFKISQAKVHLENLNRSIELKDSELIEHCLNLVIDVFFSAVKNKDTFVSRFVLEKLKESLFKMKLVKLVTLTILGRLIITFHLTNYRTKKVFKSFLKTNY